MLGAVSSHLLFLFLVNWSSFFLDLCGSGRPDSIFYSDLISIGGAMAGSVSLATVTAQVQAWGLSPDYQMPP